MLKKTLIGITVLSTMMVGLNSNVRTEADAVQLNRPVISRTIEGSVNTVQYKIAERPTPIIIDAERMGPSYSDEEIELLALLTMAEAEGECEEGKRLVIDTVLNRVDHSYWPDTIHDVIYQSGQFEAMWNGRVDRCYVTDEVRQLVIEEVASRTNTDVVYFTAGGYGKYGTPMFSVGNHYFAAY